MVIELLKENLIFNIDVKQSRDWKTNKIPIREVSIKPKGKERKTLDGAGRKPSNKLVDNRVLEWIYGRREKHLRMSCSLMKKAKVIYDELADSEESESFLPVVGG